MLGPEGQGVMKKNGFGQFKPAYAVHTAAMPAGLRSMVKPWPSS